ncbi:MAG TPA: hypothetical protein ENI92_04705 [Bacteroidetes bacterium]|nr:hypothetical protein [Bacteroidota bacterium]
MSQVKTGKELRKFALTMTVALAVIGGLTSWRGHGPTGLWLFGFSAGFLVLGLLVPRWLAPVEWAWMKLALVLQVVVTHVLLTLTFFLIITPIGLLLRLMGKDLLNLKFDKSQASYWVPVEVDGPCNRPDKPY